MKKKVLLCFLAGALAAVCAASAACASDGSPAETPRGSPGTELSALTGTAFAVTDIVPYDQPSEGEFAVSGSRIVSGSFTVTAGSGGAGGYTVRVADFGGPLAGKLYYKVTTAALSAPPENTAGWTALSNAAVYGAETGGSFCLNIILVSDDIADAGKSAAFTLGLDAA
jgi:hypothetical protein